MIVLSISNIAPAKTSVSYTHLELKEFVKHRGFRIITESNSVKLENGKGEHIIQFPLTENDAVKIFKAIQPNTFSRKTPKNQRFTRKKK